MKVEMGRRLPPNLRVVRISQGLEFGKCVAILVAIRELLRRDDVVKSRDAYGYVADVRGARAVIEIGEVDMTTRTISEVGKNVDVA